MIQKNQIVFNMLILVVSVLLSCYGTNVHTAIVEQSLLKIDIHKAVIALRGSASIKASPSVLGRMGEDNEWIVVDFENDNPSDEDWIGVFSPAILINGSCHFGNEPNDQGDICSAPIKYQFANYSNSDYTRTGKASIEFRLINQRSDYSFALFEGGLSNPHLVALSNSISFMNPKAPMYPRLAQGKSWNEMTVTWTSGYSLDEAFPLVEWGGKGQNNVFSPATTLTFTRTTMCGSPARTVGWRNPGFIHTSSLVNVWSYTLYTYRVGHLLSNGSYIWSKTYSFRPPPGQDGSNTLHRVIFFGNMGKGEPDGSLTITDQLINDLDNIDIVFHVGKMLNSRGYISRWDQFTEQIKTITSAVPYMVVSGNPELQLDDHGIPFYDSIDPAGECGVPVKTMFYVPAKNTAKSWYSAAYGYFTFCLADSAYDLSEGSEQYKFIEYCLSSESRSSRPWSIFSVYQPLGYSPSRNTKGSLEDPTVNESLHRLLQKHKVDIVFYGHAHNYERTCPLYENKCVTSERSRYVGMVNGTIYVQVSGGSSSHLSQFSNVNSGWSLYRDSDYGFVKLTSLDHNTLLFQYKKSSDGKVYDSFTIYREYSDFFVSR